MRFREMLLTAGCRMCSCWLWILLYNVLSYCSRQIFSWRNGNISRVHKLSIPFGCSQQSSAISPCITIVSVNQRKQWCKPRVYSFFCLLTWDPSNRRHQRKSEESESCQSRGQGFIQADALGHGPAKWKGPNQIGQERIWSWVWFTPDES